MGARKRVLATGRRLGACCPLYRALLSPAVRLLPSDLSDEEIVDGVSSALPLEPAHRLELLEANGPVERAERLINRLRANGSVLL